MPDKQSTSASAKSKSGASIIDWLLASFFVGPLLAYAYLGTFSRYMADDFAALRAVQAHGFFGAQINWYQKWTGRFSYSFLYSLLAVLGPATPRVLPALLVALWFLTTSWAIYQIHLVTGDLSRARVVLFAAVIMYATLETAPNVSQSLFWQTAALTHFAPLVLLSVLVGVICRGIRTKHKRFSRNINIVCAGIVTFVAGGLGDAYVVFQSCGLILLILAIEVFASSDFKSRVRVFLRAGLVGSLLALMVVVASPGNTVRQAFFPRRFGSLDMLGATMLYSAGFIGKLVLTHPIICLVLVCVPIVMVVRDFSDPDRRPWDHRLCIRLLLLIPVVVFLLIMCCTGASFYAISQMLPERARILLSLTFVCGTLIWGRAAGEFLVGRLLTTTPNIPRNLLQLALVALVLLILCPTVSLFSVFAARESAHGFAADWDRQDAQLKAAKQSAIEDVTVQQIGDFQSRTGKGASDLHLRTDPQFWINRITATYYGLRSVRASEDVVISH